MTITVEVLRPLWFRGEAQPVGMRLDVQPLDAAELVASGRAKLARQTDAGTVRDAVIADTQKALRQRASHHRDPDPRWQPL